MRVVYPEKNDNMPLYQRFEGQYRPQDAYLEVDAEGGTMWADYNSDIGNAVPCDVYENRAFRFPLHPEMTRDEVVELLDEALPYARRVEDGYEGSSYDGGHYTKDACAALDEVERLCMASVAKTEMRLACEEHEAEEDY